MSQKPKWQSAPDIYTDCTQQNHSTPFWAGQPLSSAHLTPASRRARLVGASASKCGWQLLRKSSCTCASWRLPVFAFCAQLLLLFHPSVSCTPSEKHPSKTHWLPKRTITNFFDHLPDVILNDLLLMSHKEWYHWKLHCRISILESLLQVTDFLCVGPEMVGRLSKSHSQVNGRAEIHREVSVLSELFETE
jgi:hypothetical protein